MAQAVDNLTTPARRSFPVCSGDGIEAQATRWPSDDLGNMRDLGVCTSIVSLNSPEPSQADTAQSLSA
jgi:hypothetical protein